MTTRVLGGTARLLCTLGVAIALIVGALWGAANAASRLLASNEGPSIPLPPDGEYLHGVYPGGRTGWEDDLTAADLHEYEEAVGRHADWVYFSDNWFRNRRFPMTTSRWIRDEGAIPFIRLMLRNDGYPGRDPEYALWRINAGQFDDDLQRWGQGVARVGSPVIVEWGTEMNGDWFGWNARWNGQNRGAQKFRRAYRHIVEQVERGAGAAASNITWAWHVNADSQPDTPWNQIERYYPGDEWVDWVGLSSYGALTPADRVQDWTPFREALDDVVPRLTALAPDKPVFVFEFGMTDGTVDGDAAAFADGALGDLLDGRWPEVRGFSWWNETWPNDDDPDHDTDMRVQTVPGLADVFQRHLSGE